MRAYNLSGLSIAVIVLTIVGLIAQTIGVFFLGGSSGPYGASFQAEAESFADIIPLLMTGVILAGLGLAQQIVALIWMHHASHNVSAMGRTDRTWGPGWAVGAWFIPIANYVLGFFVVREIWNGTFSQQQDWKRTAVPSWMIVWWTLFVANGVIGLAAGFTSMFTTIAAEFAGETPDLAFVEIANWVGLAVYIAAGVFFLKFVAAVKDGQTVPEEFTTSF